MTARPSASCAFEQLLKKAEADRVNLANRFDSPFAEITDEDIDSLFSE